MFIFIYIFFHLKFLFIRKVQNPLNLFLIFAFLHRYKHAQTDNLAFYNLISMWNANPFAVMPLCGYFALSEKFQKKSSTSFVLYNVALTCYEESFTNLFFLKTTKKIPSAQTCDSIISQYRQGLQIQIQLWKSRLIDTLSGNKGYLVETKK